jgi:hypothetical protein
MSIKYPEFPASLRKRFFNKRVWWNFKEKHPKELTKKHKEIKITRSRYLKGYLIYPQFKSDNKWYVLRKNSEPIAFIIRQLSIHGMVIGSFNSRINGFEKDLEKWCKEFISKNDLNLKFTTEEHAKEKIVPSPPEIPTKKVIKKAEEEEILDEVEKPDNSSI